MKTVQIQYIDFKNNDDASLNKNYPNDGLFISKIKETGLADLRFVDKDYEINFCIIPADVAEKVFNNNLISTIPNIINKPETEYSQDFILEFARILLNRKHL